MDNLISYHPGTSLVHPRSKPPFLSSQLSLKRKSDHFQAPKAPVFFSEPISLVQSKNIFESLRNRPNVPVVDKTDFLASGNTETFAPNSLSEKMDMDDLSDYDVFLNTQCSQECNMDNKETDLVTDGMDKCGGSSDQSETKGNDLFINLSRKIEKKEHKKVV